MRQQTQFDPARKEFEAYLDFSGGQNSAVSNERLSNNEFPLMLNADNSGRGSAKTRYGRSSLSSPKSAGLASSAQGIFNFYRANAAVPDLVIAAEGQLFLRKQEPPQTVTKIPISDGANLDFRFQSALPIEGTQYQNNLFVATGTKLVEVTADAAGVYSAKVVPPYTPTAMEVIYIGTNGLADNPDAYIQDGVAAGAAVEVVGIKPQYKNGAANQPINMTAYINRPNGYAGNIQYKWETKKTSETAWTTFQDFTDSNKTVTLTLSTPTKYDIKVTARKSGDTATSGLKDFTLASFTVNATADKPVMPVDAIQKCRKITLHWDRLLLYGDDKNPYQMYISDLLNPRYFPVSNTINFDFGKQEPIKAVVRFQDMLVVFTRTTIQTLTGKSTDDYKRFLIHDGMGCVADRSAVVVGNNVMFLSQDGVHALRPNPYRLETMNVVRMDQNIQREIDVTQTDACAIVHDSQYWLCFPSKKLLYRYYFERKVWVKDTSDNLNIVQFIQCADKIVNLRADASLMQHDRNVFTDAGAVYDMVIESKFYDLSASFNNKKLKRMFVLAKHSQSYDINLFMTVKADSAIVLSPQQGTVVEDNVNGWYWSTQLRPNFKFLQGTSFGTWIMGSSPFGDTELSVQEASVRGKCRRVKVTVRVPSSTPCEMYGFAMQFKMKKI